MHRTVESNLTVTPAYQSIRLAGVTYINNANAFLYHYIKEFNEKFALQLYGVKSVF